MTTKAVETLLAQLKPAKVEINIHVSAIVNVTPFVARQKVNGVLVDKVGTGVISGDPDLTITEGRLCWRVPIILALPGGGNLGQVGTVDVDVQTGEVLADDLLLNEIARYADRLAARTTLS